MTSLRPGHKPPQVTIAALTCKVEQPMCIILSSEAGLGFWRILQIIFTGRQED